MNSSMSNNRVLRPDERLSEMDWPVLQQIEAPELSMGDVLLVCAGFEDRCIQTLLRACDAGRSGFSLGLISYLPQQSQNKIEEMSTISRHAGLQVTEFVYDRENPSGIGEKLLGFTQTFNRVFVDISGMSRLLIIQTLVALIGKKTVHIIYGEAQEYPPSEAQFNRDHGDNIAEPALSYLSSGIFEIAATPELASVSMLGEAIRLIVFPSFDPAQLTNLLQELQPTYTELIHGTPPDQKNKWRTGAVRRINTPAFDGLQGREDHQACTLDYRDTLNILLQRYAERSMFDRLVVAPTGSKMQAVAVGLFRAALYDVQIVYPTPQIFTEPERYTSGLRQLYQIDFPPEAFADVIKNTEDDSGSLIQGHL